eukprot:3186430-Pleurochrysis_carterae.AAC.2
MAVAIWRGLRIVPLRSVTTRGCAFDKGRTVHGIGHVGTLDAHVLLPRRHLDREHSHVEGGVDLALPRPVLVARAHADLQALAQQRERAELHPLAKLANRVSCVGLT